jgi:hypothetical protein
MRWNCGDGTSGRRGRGEIYNLHENVNYRPKRRRRASHGMISKMKPTIE